MGAFAGFRLFSLLLAVSFLTQESHTLLEPKPLPTAKTLRFHEWCYTLFTEKASWLDANADCSNRNSYLASIHNELEGNVIAAYIRKHTKDNSNVWIGMDVSRCPRFGWANNGAASYLAWSDGEPRCEEKGMFCGGLSSSSGYKEWVAEKCDEERPYLCMNSGFQCQ